MARASWERQLEAYTKAASGSTPPPHRAARVRMADAVRVAPESPEAWAALLAAEEAALGASTGTLTGERGAGARGGVTLFDLYAAATKAVPRANNYTNDAYVRIWLGFARHQWCVFAMLSRPAGSLKRHAPCCSPLHAATKHTWPNLSHFETHRQPTSLMSACALLQGAQCRRRTRCVQDAALPGHRRFLCRALLWCAATDQALADQWAGAVLPSLHQLCLHAY